MVYSTETLARYLEIPVPDLKTINPETIELDVLYSHVKLESEFQSWLILPEFLISTLGLARVIIESCPLSVNV